MAQHAMAAMPAHPLPGFAAASPFVPGARNSTRDTTAFEPRGTLPPWHEVPASRTNIISAERQTAARKAARLYKSCEGIVSQDTDYTPHIRGYMRDMELPWPHRSNRNEQIAVELMVKAKLYWSWPFLVKIEFTDLGNGATQVSAAVAVEGGDIEWVNDIRERRGKLGDYEQYFNTLFEHFVGGSKAGITLKQLLWREESVLETLTELLDESPTPVPFTPDP
ncbi:hypothetical protein HPB48_000805 [Haemaphysalis longicornis]|uniref:Uncharacterized protein n=1 Tax=Haemaphysalis longicornis TaxID=44386 RepID=A0A9J6GHF4_HAELO|nr:hypothetical protein HPB48_000805 [Haemaphysalis longicornis]